MTRGYASLHMRYPNGTDVQRTPGLTEKKEDHEEHVMVLRVETDDSLLHLCFRRGEFSRMLALLGESEPTEVTIDVQEIA